MNVENNLKVEITIRNFGLALTSRPEGREAALSALAYNLSGKVPESIVLNFEGVLIMTPSWLSEFIQTLQDRSAAKIEYVNTGNITVDASIQFVEEEAATRG